MADEPWVERSFEAPNLALRCDCGWTGVDADVDEWDVQRERDRVVRKCPECDTAVPEWGTLAPIDGVTRVARGSLRTTLVEEGIVDEE
jgi:hypothetical protein